MNTGANANNNNTQANNIFGAGNGAQAININQTVQINGNALINQNPPNQQPANGVVIQNNNNGANPAAALGPALNLNV